MRISKLVYFIDSSSLRLEFPEFKSLFDIAYKNKLPEEQIRELFDLLDEEKKDYLNLENFFGVVDLIENNQAFTKEKVLENKIVARVRSVINKIFKLDKIVKSPIFHILMRTAIFFNLMVLILELFIHDHDAKALFRTIDSVFIWIYFAEVMINLCGLGLFTYLESKVNKINFLFTILSLVLYLTIDKVDLSFTAQSPQALRLLQIQSTGNIFRIFRFRNCKLIGKKMSKAIKRLEALIKNILTCSPIVLKLGVILFMLTYIYNVIGMEILNPEFEHEESDKYTGFGTFGQGLLTLFHILNQAGRWADVEINFMERFQDATKPALFFNTYHLISTFVIVSLLNGLIWEIFAFNQKNSEEQEKIEKILTKIKEVSLNLEGIKASSMKNLEETENKKEDTNIKKENPDLPVIIVNNSTAPIIVPLRIELNDQSNVSSDISEYEGVVPLCTMQEELIVNNTNFTSKNPFGHINITPICSSSNNANSDVLDSLAKTDKACECNDIMSGLTEGPEIKNTLSLPSKENKNILRTLHTHNYSNPPCSFALIPHSASEKPAPESMSDLKLSIPSTNDKTFDGDHIELELTFYTNKISVMVFKKYRGNQYDNISEPKDKLFHERIYLRIEPENLEEINVINELYDSDNSRNVLNSPKHNTQLEHLTKAEEKKKKLQMSSPTVDRLIRKALLRGTNDKVIKDFEDGYLRAVYGNLFDKTKEIETDPLFNLLDTENHCLIRFMRLLKQHDIECNHFINVLSMIEKSITENLLTKGSVGKFIFMNGKDKWFFINQKGQSPYIQFLQNGPWNYFKYVFKDVDCVYESKDILYPGSDQKYKNVTSRFSKDIIEMAGSNGFKLADYSECHYYWDFHAIPFELSDETGSRTQLENIFKEEGFTRSMNIEECIIRKGMYISIRQNGITKENPLNRAQEKGLQKLQIISRLKSESKKNSYFANDTSRDISQCKESETYLPTNEYLEFLGDLKDSIQLHKDKLMSKMSSYLAEKVSQEKEKNI